MTFEERQKLQELVEMLNFNTDQACNVPFILHRAGEVRLELIRLIEGIKEAKA